MAEVWKIKCVKSGLDCTKGKIYEIRDGIFVDDDGFHWNKIGDRKFTNQETFDMLSEFVNGKFIRIDEEGDTPMPPRKENTDPMMEVREAMLALTDKLVAIADKHKMPRNTLMRQAANAACSMWMFGDFTDHVSEVSEKPPKKQDEYAVGDKVKIVNRRGSHWNSDGGMDVYFGQTLTISYAGGDCYQMEECGQWCWSAADFEGKVNY